MVPLPVGFNDIITDTAWDRTTFREAPGPVTPQEWQVLKGSLFDTVSLTFRWRVQLDPDTNTLRIRVDPVPAEREMSWPSSTCRASGGVRAKAGPSR